MSERTAKAERRAERIPPHVHCHECHRAVAPDDARPGVTPVTRPTPQGLQVIPRQVPLCLDCFTMIQDNERQAQAPSKLIVPRTMVD